MQERSGHGAAARATLGDAIDIGRGCGDFRTVAVARARLALVLRAAGETQPALRLAEDAVAWFSEGGGGDGAALAEEALAALRADAAAAGRPAGP